MMFCQPLSIRTDIINTTIAITRRSNKTLFMFSYILTIIFLPLQICITCLHLHCDFTQNAYKVCRQSTISTSTNSINRYIFDVKIVAFTKYLVASSLVYC